MVLGALEPLHLHVLARDVIDDRGDDMADMRFVQFDGLRRIRDQFAFDRDRDAYGRALRADAMVGILLVAWSRVHRSCSPAAILCIACSISSGLTSRTWVPTDQRWPNGSSIWP